LAAASFQASDARKVLGLLAETQGDRAPQAASELRALGFDEAAVRLGGAIPTLDADSRAELARSLAGNEQQGRLPVLRLLTFDPSDSVRAAALEALRGAPPDPALRARVLQMSESDESSIVRGYARLLAADWGADPSALRFDPMGPAQPRPRQEQPPPRSAAQSPTGRIQSKSQVRRQHMEVIVHSSSPVVPPCRQAVVFAA
jgi:hypothetical protein